MALNEYLLVHIIDLWILKFFILNCENRKHNYYSGFCTNGHYIQRSWTPFPLVWAGATMDTSYNFHLQLIRPLKHRSFLEVVIDHSSIQCLRSSFIWVLYFGLSKDFRKASRNALTPVSQWNRHSPYPNSWTVRNDNFYGKNSAPVYFAFFYLSLTYTLCLSR